MIKHVYVHIPFCLSRCGYCSFYAEVLERGLVRKYLDILKQEIQEYQNEYEIVPETLYFGGGTPSLLQPTEIEEIIKCFEKSKISEITLEINPATVTRKDLEGYRAIGINRASFGIQSMHDVELEFLGRLHRTHDVLQLYQIGINELFEMISFDLIYGLPNQCLTRIESTLVQLLEFEPNHFSIYCLTLENDVPLFAYRDYLPTDEVLAEMYFKIIEILTRNGYAQYELSSFCKQGQKSFHNEAYWSGKHFLGFGAGASGYLPGVRYRNSRIKEYLQGNYQEERFQLTKEDEYQEYLITGLRKVSGVSLTEFEQRFGFSLLEKYEQEIKQLLQKGLIEVTTDLKIKSEHLFIANEVLCEFV